MKGKRISSQLHFFLFIFALMTVVLGLMIAIIFANSDIFYEETLSLLKKSPVEYGIKLTLSVMSVVLSPFWVFMALFNRAYYVEDRGNALLIKKRKSEVLVDLKDIKYISTNYLSHDITLEFSKSGTLGKKIKFTPEIDVLFSSNKIFEDLKDRIYMAHKESEK